MNHITNAYLFNSDRYLFYILKLVVGILIQVDTISFKYIIITEYNTITYSLDKFYSFYGV